VVADSGVVGGTMDSYIMTPWWDRGSSDSQVPWSPSWSDDATQLSRGHLCCLPRARVSWTTQRAVMCARVSVDTGRLLSAATSTRQQTIDIWQLQARRPSTQRAAGLSDAVSSDSVDLELMTQCRVTYRGTVSLENKTTHLLLLTCRLKMTDKQTIYVFGICQCKINRYESLCSRRWRCVLFKFFDCNFYANATRHCRRRQFVVGLSRCPLRSFVRSFVRTDIVPAISHERLEQFWWNWQGIFTSPYYDLSRFWRSEVKVTADCPSGESVHVDAGASNSGF